jgi:hypothetical protein
VFDGFYYAVVMCIFVAYSILFTPHYPFLPLTPHVLMSVIIILDLGSTNEREYVIFGLLSLA